MTISGCVGVIQGVKRKSVLIQSSVKDKSQRIDVNGMIIVLMEKDFRSHVVFCSLYGKGAGIICIYSRDTEITDFINPVFVDKDVLRLYIAMDYSLLLKKL